MSGFNGAAYSNIQAENDLTQILAKFDSEYILDIITCSLQDIPMSIAVNKPNAIYSLDMKYANNCKQYADNLEVVNNLKQSRYELYLEIIDYICNYFDLDIDKRNIDNQNIYYIAYNMYEIFINYYKNTVDFFVSYIIKNKSTIYDACELSDCKKSKDTSTIYNKKIYKNHKIAIIVSNLDQVIQYIGGAFIPFDVYLKTIYPDNLVMVQMMLDIIAPRGDHFRSISSMFMDRVLSDLNTRQNLISDVRIQLSNSTELVPEMDISNYIEA